MSLKSHTMQRSSIENYSCSVIPKMPKLRHIKRCDILVHDDTLQGDAPKQFVQIYPGFPQPYHKCNTSHWPYYIAKTGQKWYPLESVTEYLLNQLGVIFGLVMAESEIAVISGQVRFLSKFFRSEDEELVHGAEIFAGYMNDEEIVEQIENEGLSRDLFTMQFVEKAVRSSFPDHYKDILHDLVRLLLFDALVGNNDRHYFNWGVLRSLTESEKVRFSPVYDTARGLFWNYSDNNLYDKLVASGNMKQQIAKYCKNCRPKLGWSQHSKLNHFDLVRHIYETQFYIAKQEIQELYSEDMLQAMKQYVKSDFSQLYSELRIQAICECLDYRYSQIKSTML